MRIILQKIPEHGCLILLLINSKHFRKDTWFPNGYNERVLERTPCSCLSEPYRKYLSDPKFGRSLFWGPDVRTGSNQSKSTNSQGEARWHESLLVLSHCSICPSYFHVYTMMLATVTTVCGSEFSRVTEKGKSLC